jgi:hypothetical protein
MHIANTSIHAAVGKIFFLIACFNEKDGMTCQCMAIAAADDCVVSISNDVLPNAAYQHSLSMKRL